MKNPFAWYPDWTGETVVIVASGPSAKDVPLELGKDRARFIAVNNSWLLCPWADVLYACDFRWWDTYIGWQQFKGLKVSQDRLAAQRWPRTIKHVTAVRGIEHLLLEPGLVGWAGNSGFHALNLAVHFKARRIVLVGFDMTLDYGTHWHGAHTGKCQDPQAANVVRWRKAVDAAYEQLRGLGIGAVNCSPISALTQYPKMDFKAALDG